MRHLEITREILTRPQTDFGSIKPAMNPIPAIASLPRKTRQHRVIHPRVAAHGFNFVFAVLIGWCGAGLTDAHDQCYTTECPGRSGVISSFAYPCPILSVERILEADCAGTATSDARFVPDSIVLIPLTPQPSFLVFRRFTVASGTFIRGLQGVHEHSLVAISQGAGSGNRTHGTNFPADPNQLLREYFVAAGLFNFGGNNHPYSPQLFFDADRGTVLVGASPADMEIIEEAIEVLQPMPQVQFTVRLFEATVDEIKQPEPSFPNHGRVARPAERLFEAVQVLSGPAARETLTARDKTARHISTSEGIIPSGAQTQILKLGTKQALASNAGVTTNGSAVPIRVTIVMLATMQPDGGVAVSFIFDSFQPVAWPGGRASTAAVPVASASAPATPPAPRYRGRQTVKTVTIPSGHSVLLALDADESGNQPSAKSPLGLKLLVTPVVVAPVINRSH